ncbi:uncharacterized protein LOC140707481 [Pogona vitticeps]
MRETEDGCQHTGLGMDYLIQRTKENFFCEHDTDESGNQLSMKLCCLMLEKQAGKASLRKENILVKLTRLYIYLHMMRDHEHAHRFLEYVLTRGKTKAPNQESMQFWRIEQ